ncbi:MAG: peptidoglycan-binding protein [Clostridia bacterium]|nr:peptidoglycan-binding protein [Clostridia bacterium]
MKFNMYDQRQNVLEAESFLRANQRLEGGILINPDGLFEEETTQAVLLFQRQNGLPQTGVIDFATWTLLSETADAICLEDFCLFNNLDITARR